MAFFKCKMCGGDLAVEEGLSVAECEYCGTKQTLPKANDEVIQNLFNRANNLRIKCEFDKAEQIYEKIVQKNDAEAEAHWGIVLCKYGIEYVEDPKTFKRIPTCHRTSYDAVTADADYLAAMEYADPQQKSIYEAEAKAIDAIQKNILSIVKNEKPFDVFICYKETDESGKRTVDSTIANDIYYQLTQEGLKVFYAAITLEDKLGQEYEPYIFAALNSAKVMLVIGTKPQYFSAVWVKNEWSRFLKLMKSDRSKLLIPCYKDMDAYDLPEEFSHLQAQDMSKIGFINDVVRGIRKVTAASEPQPAVVKETVVTGGSANTAPLLERAFMFLEDGDWASADEYCEKVLDVDPRCPDAYLGKLMAELRVRKQEALKNQAEPFDHSNNYQKAVRFGDDKLKTELEGYIAFINDRNEAERIRKENQRKDAVYEDALRKMEHCGLAPSEKAYLKLAETFASISGWKDADAKKQECEALAEDARKDAALTAGRSKMRGSIPEEYEMAIKILIPISGWKDAEELIARCRQKIEGIKEQEKAYRLEKERQAELARKEAEKKAKRNKKIAAIMAAVAAAAVAFVIVRTSVIIPNGKYNDAVALMEAGNYRQAVAKFIPMYGYKDSAEQIAKARTNFRNQLDVLTVSAGRYHTVGLKADGTVVAAGDNEDGQCNVTGWTDIVSVSAGGWHTVGLKADGTVVAVGYNEDGRCNVAEWTDIVSVSAGGRHTVGLKADGTVVAVGDNDYGVCEVTEWTDIVAVSAGSEHTVGLKADGTAVAVGRREFGLYEAGWTDMIAVSAGSDHTVGLKADGTTLTMGYNHYGQRDVDKWTDVVSVSAGNQHTVGLKADGTVVAVGNNERGHGEVAEWTDIRVP